MSSLQDFNNELVKILELGEGQFIEFKSSLDKNIAKELVAFANASGGVIYIGITDSGKINGVNISNDLISKIQDIAYGCDPSIIMRTKKLDNVLAIYVDEGKNKPYSCSAGFYMRMGANSQKMKRDEILALAIKSGKVRFDEQICPNFDWKDFDDEKFNYYLRLAKISNNLAKEDILRNLRVMNEEGFTNAGVLFFAKDPYKYIISSKVRLVHFKGDEHIHILDKKVINYGVIGNIEFAVEYLQSRIPVEYKIEKLAREEISEYPFTAYREAIVNAIIHFDYFLGDSVTIEKSKSKIIIYNKGELLFPLNDFGRRSEARNRLMVDLLARTEFMEKVGTGIKRIKEACRNNGNIVSFNFTDAFWITMASNNLKSKETTQETTQKTTQKTTPKTTPKTTKGKILQLLKKNPNYTRVQLAKLTNRSEGTIKEHIAKLKKEGKLIRVGSKKSGYWKIMGEKK